MPGYSERLAAAKAKNTEAQERKTAEAAAEAKKAEAEAARQKELGELGRERNDVQVKLDKTEADADEARKAKAEAEAYAKEQGDALDAEAKTEIDAIKAEASEAIEKFEALKAELARVDAKIKSLQSTEAPAEAHTEEARELPFLTEQPFKAEATAENPENTDSADAENKNHVTGEAVKEYLESNPVNSAKDLAKLAEELANNEAAEFSQTGIKALREVLQTASGDEKAFDSLAEDKKKMIIGLAKKLDDAERISRLRIPKQRSEAVGLAVKTMTDHEIPVSRRYDSLAQIGHDAGEISQEDFKKVYADLGPSFIAELKALSEAKRAGSLYPDAKPSLFRESNALQLRNFTRTSANGPGIGLKLERANPKMADEYHEFILDSVAEELMQKEPSSEIAFVLPDTLSAAYARLAAGEKLSPNFENKLSKVLKALKQNPEVAPTNFGNPGLIKRNIWAISGKEPSPETVKNVEEAIKRMM